MRVAVETLMEGTMRLQLMQMVRGAAKLGLEASVEEALLSLNSLV